MVYQALLALKGKGAEEFLRKQILLPVLRHKYGGKEVHDWCGVYERGADVGCWVEGPSGRTELVGIVIKVGHITKPICQQILNQAEQALVSGHPTGRVGGTDEASAERAWAVVTDPWESWTEGARTLWNDKCVPQSILRDVERIEPSQLAKTICDNDPAGDTREKLLEKVGLREPISIQPIRPSELRSAISLIATQPRWAALRVSKLAITHWSAVNRSEATAAVRGALNSREIPFMAKRLLAGWLAEHPLTDSAVQSLVQEVIKDTVLARHFLAQMDGPDWLELAKPEFENIARDGPALVRRALALTVARLCGNKAQLALDFLRILWTNDERPVGWACVEIISQLGLWEKKDVEDLLWRPIEEQGAGLGFVPFALAKAARPEAARGDKVTADFAVKWLATWTINEMREHPNGGPHFGDSLRHAFGDVVEQYPASVLPHAAELVEANCRAGEQLGDELYGLKDTDLRVHLQFRIGVRGSREEPAFVVLTALMQLAESKYCPMRVRDVVRQLLDSQYTAARAIAIHVCRANPKKFIPQCVSALTDRRNLVYPLGDVTRPLLGEAYHLLTKKQQDEVDDVLLRLKSETETEEYKGISQLFALRSIPPGEYRSEKVNARIRLLEQNEHLRDLNLPTEPETQVYIAPAPDSQIAKQIHSMSVEQVIESLREAEKSEAHRFEMYDTSDAVKTRAERDRQFALELAAKLAATPSVPSRYAEGLLGAIRKAHVPEDHMEAVWRLRGLDDSGVHGIAADIIEKSAPDLSDE